MTRRIDRIEATLRAAFDPIVIEVVDDSHRHAGHAGAVAHKPGAAATDGETHYSVFLVSASFSGKSRVERSRAVHATLANELAGGLHALALKLQTPEEHTSATIT
jgi:BolA protein